MKSLYPNRKHTQNARMRRLRLFRKAVILIRQLAEKNLQFSFTQATADPSSVS